MTPDSLPGRFAARMGQLLGPDFPGAIALAVSGGGDSMAMLTLAHDWARVWGVGLWVVTVDHGLRAESAAEAALVARECAHLGHPHATLRWHWDGTGNLQDAARRARLSLIDRWRGGLSHVLFAHTQDDVAETFLMRLARGSGVEGLAAMSDSRRVRPHRDVPAPIPPEDVSQTAAPPGTGPDAGAGFRVIRPLLAETRADLRHHVRTLQVPFVDDPSNADPRFGRARARAALAALADLGIETASLAATADRMARAARALRLRAAAVAADLVLVDAHGTPGFARDGFAAIERDTQARLLAGLLQLVASARYRPRAAALEALLDRVLAGGGGTLHGAEVRVGRSRVEILREAAALEGREAAPGQLWDARWRLHGPALDGTTIRALGDAGWAQLPRAAPPDAPPFHIARTLPAAFAGDRLVAFAPAKFGPAHAVEFVPRDGDLVSALKSR